MILPDGWKQAVTDRPQTFGLLSPSAGTMPILTLCAGFPDGVENSTSDSMLGSLITRLGCKTVAKQTPSKL